MKIAFVYEIPDDCPDNCPEKGMPFDQGSLCFRCPILNCKDIPEIGPLCLPEHYRPDWAREWERWFKEGMQGLPQLYF